MAVKSRRAYKGAPVSTTLSIAVNTTATTFNLSASVAASWPTSGTPFFCVIDPGGTKEEKVCVIYASATTLTVVDPAVTSGWTASVNGRGVDDTSAQTHDAGATIYPVFTAYEANQANELVATYAHQGAFAYQGASTFSELQIGTANQVLRVNSGATAPEWGQVATAGIADSAVTTAKIADSNVTTAKLADINVTTAKIADSNVTTAKIADLNVTTAKINDAAVTTAKILDANVTTAKIADSAVTSAKIADGTIVDADINASAAIALSKLATGALPTAITVASANIVDGTIATADIADSAVTSAKIADGTIVAGDIADNTITSAKLLTGTIATSKLATATVQLLTPSGALMPYAGASAPTGWLLCDGSAVSRTTYSDLFTAISTTFGAGDGSTTFNIPDLRGRTIAGKDNMGGTAANRVTTAASQIDGTSLGYTGGSQSVALTLSNLPDHTHNVGFTTLTRANGTGASYGDITQGSSTTGNVVDTVGAGLGLAHQNMQPTMILNYIIKT